MNYRLPISTEFTSLVFSYPSEHELVTVLVNFDKNFKIIDFESIAYDEIAESAFRSSSEISADKIKLTASDYSGDEPKFEILTYSIKKDGKIEETK